MQVVWYETNIAASHGDVDGMASIDETKSWWYWCYDRSWRWQAMIIGKCWWYGKSWWCGEFWWLASVDGERWQELIGDTVGRRRCYGKYWSIGDVARVGVSEWVTKVSHIKCWWLPSIFRDMVSIGGERKQEMVKGEYPWCEKSLERSLSISLPSFIGVCHLSRVKSLSSMLAIDTPTFVSTSILATPSISPTFIPLSILAIPRTFVRCHQLLSYHRYLLYFQPYHQYH